MDKISRKKLTVIATSILFFQAASAMPQSNPNALDQTEKSKENYNTIIRMHPKSSQLYANRAARYFSDKQYAQALLDINTAISLDPQNRQSYVWRMMIYSAMGNNEKAEADRILLANMDPRMVKINADLSKSPNSQETLLRRAQLYWQQGLFDKALEVCAQAIKADPNKASAYVQRAQWLMGHGGMENGRVVWNHRQDALADLNRAISLSPQLSEAYRVRAQVYKDLGRGKEAQADLDKAIEFGSNDPKLLVSRGTLLSQQGNYERAVVDLSKAIAIDSNNAVAYQIRGYALNAMGDLEKAVSDYDKAIKLAPDNQNAYAEQAEIYKKLGKNELAIANYTKLISFNPKYEPTLVARASLYEKINENEKAIADLSKVISLQNVNFPGATDPCLVQRARVYEKLSEHPKAIDDLNSALSFYTSKDNSSVYRDQAKTIYKSLGEIYTKIGNDSKAIDSYSRGIALDDTDWELFYHRAQCYEKVGKHGLAAQDRRAIPYRGHFALYNPDHLDRQRSQDAITQYGRSIDFDSNDSVARFLRAWNYFLLGQYKSALSDLTQYIKLNPKDGKGFFLRALCYEKLGQNKQAETDRMTAQALGVYDTSQLIGEFMHW